MDKLTQNIKEMCIEANHFLSPDMDAVLKAATEKEDGVERLEDDSFKSITTLNMKGISNGSEYILFAPGTPIHMLPENMEELLNKDLSNQDSLEMFVLLDTEQQIAFWAEMPR